MSLIKQLWIAVALLMTLAFAGSFVVSTLSAKQYLEQQLQLKNHDNAASLALSMSQMDKDPISIELLLAAQFDTGHYQRIRLSDPHGQVLQERAYHEQGLDGVPNWFIRLISFDVVPGMAQVQDGWHQYGTLQVESHSRFAYAALWEGTLRLLQWFLIGAVGAGLLGTWILKTITRPLDGVVAQAEAIGNRRFITATEPKTLEFRALAKAMNSLSERVKNMLEKEASQLEEYRRQNQHDKLTGLANREHFLNQLDTVLQGPDSPSHGTMIFTRLLNLAEINRQLGRPKTDHLISELAALVQSFTEQRNQAICGRINNTDFALTLAGNQDTGSEAQLLGEQLFAYLDTYAQTIHIDLVVAAAYYQHGESIPQVLMRTDHALAVAEQTQHRHIEVVQGASVPAYGTADAWRSAIEAALNDGVSLQQYAVKDMDGILLHREAPVRLQMAGETRNAGYFMPWARRLGLMPKLDLAVAKEAVTQIRAQQQAIGINLSGESLGDAWFRGELYALLQQAQTEAKQLWIELPESVAMKDLAEFKALCLALHPLGCRIGLEHVGSGFARIGDLHELGLDYVKVDAAIIRDINNNSANQTFLRGLCTIAHSIGLLVIAEGVRSEAEQHTLKEIGVDGMTGPGVQ